MKKYNQLKADIILDFYLDVICEKLQVKKENVMRKLKDRELADIRAMACFMTKEMFSKVKLKHIAEHFGQKHSTVLHAINKVKDLKGLDVEITETVNYCQNLDFVEAILKSYGFEQMDHDHNHFFKYHECSGYTIGLDDCQSIGCTYVDDNIIIRDIDIFDAIIISKNINSNPLGVLINSLKN